MVPELSVDSEGYTVKYHAASSPCTSQGINTNLPSTLDEVIRIPLPPVLAGGNDNVSISNGHWIRTHVRGNYLYRHAVTFRGCRPIYEHLPSIPL
jgi:hypothetical protein